MTPGLLFVVASLAVYRVTRLVVRDTFPPILAVRTRLYRLGYRVEEVPVPGAVATASRALTGEVPTREVPTRLEWLADLVTCQWCASGWVALAGTLGLDLLTDVSVPVPVAWWLATWAIATSVFLFEDVLVALGVDHDETN